MKNAVMSFSASVRSVIRGTESESLLRDADLLVFGCVRDHALPESDNVVPNEVAMLSSNKKAMWQYMNDRSRDERYDLIPAELVDGNIVDKWKSVRVIIDQKDSEGKVFWKYSYPTPDIENDGHSNCGRIKAQIEKNGYAVWDRAN